MVAPRGSTAIWTFVGGTSDRSRSIELGRKMAKIGEVLRLGPGSILELSKANGEPLDVYVNNRLIARGEAVVVGERYGIRLTEVLVGDERGARGSKE